MANGAPIQVIQIFGSESIAASGNSTFDINLERHNIGGFFSLQVAVSGDGTCKAEYLLSNDNTNFIEPTGASDIFSSFTKTSGPGSDGKDIYSFEPEVAGWLRIKITETGGADSVTVSAYLAMQ